MRDEADHVVLVDEDGRPTGTRPRATVHNRSTPLHLGFSCYLVDPQRGVFLTRRALTKRTWPGVWTNSFCGHPRPGETWAEAVRRHALHELGLAQLHPGVLLPSFRYSAVDVSGTAENEFCPVFVAKADVDFRLNPDEACDSAWVGVDSLVGLVAEYAYLVSPWMVAQLAIITSLGDDLWAPQAHLGPLLGQVPSSHGVGDLISAVGPAILDAARASDRGN